MDPCINQSGSLLPPSGRYSVYSPPGSSYGAKQEPSESSGFPLSGHGNSSTSGHLGIGISKNSGPFSHDISQMPDNPPKNLGHRRAHSEILTLPDDISFDSDLGVVGGFDGPSYSDDAEEDLLSMYLDIDKLNSSAASAFLVDESSTSAGSPPKPVAASVMGRRNSGVDVGEKPRTRHMHSKSMDGSATIKSEMLTSGTDETSSAEAKKAMSAAKLAELALIDPKRAKRVWANRQSAARSKERKMRYIAELERKVQTLQTEATSLSAQLTLLQRDTNGLIAKNSELKLRLKTMEQQVHLQDALHEALEKEIQHLKTLIGQIPNGGCMMNLPQCFGQSFYPNNTSVHTTLAAQQFQQLQINSMRQPHGFQQQQTQHQQQQSLMKQQEQMTGYLKMMNSFQSHVQNDGPAMIGASLKD